MKNSSPAMQTRGPIRAVMVTDRPVPSRPRSAPRNNVVTMAPAAMATQRTGSAPRVTTTTGVTSIKHRAFLKAINNSIVYSVERVPCNPGLGGSFPWLSKMAKRYEEYRFTKLRYEFRSVAATSTPGVVMMSFDYDAADENPTSKAVQAQTIPNSESNAWMNNDLTIPLDKSWRFVRSGVLGSNLDIKTYDAGSLLISSAYGSGIVCGELYVEYSVEFRRPTDGPEVSGQLHALSTSFTDIFPVNGVTFGGKAFPFSREGPMKLRVDVGGEYLVAVLVGLASSTLDYVVPTTDDDLGSITIMTQNRTTTKILALLRVRSGTGSVITFTNTVYGTGMIDTRIYVGSADYETLFIA